MLLVYDGWSIIPPIQQSKVKNQQSSEVLKKTDNKTSEDYALKINRLPMRPDCTYHLYANGFGNLFKSNENYRYFLKLHDDFILPVAETLACCLMPNHIRYLFRTKTEEELSGMYPLKYPDEQVFKGLELLQLPQLFKGLKPLKSLFTMPLFEHFLFRYPGFIRLLQQDKYELIPCFKPIGSNQ